MRWRAFPLHPETPPEGRLLSDLFRGYPTDINEIIGRLKRTAAELGLPFGERTRTYNSRLAQEMGLWADEEGAGDAFHLEAFKAYFVDGRNIFQIPVLLDLAAAAGLSTVTAENVLKNRQFKDAVDRDWSDARESLITAAPTFVMNGDRIVGAQPYQMLENLVIMHGAKERIAD